MKFNLVKFGVKNSQSEIEITGMFLSEIKGSIGFGSDLTIENVYTSVIQRGYDVLTIGSYINQSYENKIESMLKLEKEHYIKSVFLEEVKNNIKTVSNIYLYNDNVINCISKSCLGKDFKLDADINFANVLSENNIGKEFDLEQLFSEIVSTTMNANILETKELILMVNIEPGQTLIIDSEFYTAFLDNQNVLDKHKGDWIEIDREVKNICLDSGTGGEMEAKILYEERWL